MARLAVTCRAIAGRTSHFVPGGARPGAFRARTLREEMEMETNIKIAAVAIGGLVLGVGFSGLGIGPGVLHAQSNAPYYEVAEIQVTDQPAYEASGVVEIRDMLKKNGVKVIAGGYNKTQSYAGMPIANRYLIFQFPDKATHDKVWTDTKAWAQKALNAGHMSEFRVIGVEAAQPM
jgi:uncharacterized protein (DUF1330 family)